MKKYDAGGLEKLIISLRGHQEDLQGKEDELEKIKEELERKERQVAELQYNTGYVYSFPLTSTMPRYEQLKAENRSWYSQVFYTSKSGFLLYVHAISVVMWFLSACWLRS